MTEHSFSRENFVTSLQGGAFTPDGEKITWELRTADGQAHRFWLEVATTPKLISYLLQLSGAAQKVQRGTSLQNRPSAAALQADTFQIGRGPRPGDFTICFNIGDAPLRVELTRSEATQLTDMLRQLLSAP